MINSLFPLHKPFSKVCPADIWTSLKEKITLMTIDLDCIPVTLAACFQCCCRSYIQYLIDGIFPAIFPAEASWEKISVFGEGSNNGNIDFSLCCHLSSPRSERCLRKLLLDWMTDPRRFAQGTRVLSVISIRFAFLATSREIVPGFLLIILAISA